MLISDFYSYLIMATLQKELLVQARKELNDKKQQIMGGIRSHKTDISNSDLIFLESSVEEEDDEYIDPSTICVVLS